MEAAIFLPTRFSCSLASLTGALPSKQISVIVGEKAGQEAAPADQYLINWPTNEYSSLVGHLSNAFSCIQRAKPRSLSFDLNWSCDLIDQHQSIFRLKMAASNLQSMQQYWKNFNLPEIQKDLDVTATDLASRQDESEVARKKLVEQSRDFKKNTPEDVRRVVAPLLKSFQGEIDSLSKRSKSAEAAFLAVYKQLIDAPDPSSSLEHAILLQKKAQKAKDLETENRQLRDTLEEYNHEFAEIKNQEVTIKQLREKLKDFEEKMEHNAQLKAKEKEKELQRLFGEKERQLQDTQLEVAKKLGEAEHKVATLQSALESTQSELFDLKTKYDEATSAKADEMDIIMADLERANERAVGAERQSDDLRQHLASAAQNLQQAEQMQQAPDMEQAIDILKRSSLEVELAAKEKEISQLVEDVQRLQSTLAKLRDSSAAQTTKVAKLEEELTAKNNAFRLLEERLHSQEDYDEIRRELSVLKSIEFLGEPDEKSEDPQARTLETLLLKKNRSLQSENTQVKVSHSELTDTTSSASPASSDVGPSLPVSSPASHPLAATEAFASMIGQELVNNFHLQNQLQMAAVSAAAALQNGHQTVLGSHPTAFMPVHVPMVPPPLTPTSPKEGRFPPSPMTSTTPCSSGGGIGGGSGGRETPANLQKIQSIARSESTNAHILDTADVAQRIREILSTNNIGQRLFAKHVLGLSQGTVSELLSKPKHWDKLTEKGRESYRKMHSWASEESNVHTLKAISPKKGAQPIVSSYRQEDSATEERIAEILSEAQRAMQAKHSQEKTQVASAMVASIYQQELAKIATSKDAMQLQNSQTEKETRGREVAGEQGGRGRKAQTDSNNLSRDMVARIYREELAKLAHAAEMNGNIAESTMYRQELARLAQNAQQRNKYGDDGMFKDGVKHDIENKENVHRHDLQNHITKDGSLDLSMKVKQEPRDLDRESLSSRGTPNLNPVNLSSAVTTSATSMAGSAFNLVRPRSNSSTSSSSVMAGDGPLPYPPGMAPTSDALSPLQRMQTIANSLMSKNGSANLHSPRPLRAVLPPITQEQFDKFPNVDTDGLVKKVKDVLSQFSISQRLFGENVLGLSQGSVSDLLARPKPWHMLTQKGREPFIRMHMFLEDHEAIPSLVASQYHIPAEKFLRKKDNYSCDPTGESCSSSPLDIASCHATITSANAALSTCYSSASSPSDNHSPPSTITKPPSSCSSSTMVVSQDMRMTPTPNTPAILPEKLFKGQVRMSAASMEQELLGLRQIGGVEFLPGLSHLAGHPFFPMIPPTMSPVMSSTLQPSLFEMAAMTHELDTILITTKVKEVLQFNNLGQKLFGEAVLGLSQGSVSELLSKPKPWQMLSLKGREPFIKMHIWLSDPLNVERLRLYQSEMKVRKRKGSQDDRPGCDGSGFPQKKPRVFFSESQKEVLRKAYTQDPYPNQARIEQLANQLSVGTKTVVNWFHNHRMRAKQQHTPSASPHSRGSPQSGKEPQTPPNEDIHWNSSRPDTIEDESNNSMGSESQSGTGGGLQNSSDQASQWIFPSYEAVVKKEGNEAVAQQLVDGEKMEEMTCRKECEEEKEGALALIDVALTTAKMPSGSRRKRAKPQWVYEGTQLDKSLLLANPDDQAAAAAAAGYNDTKMVNGESMSDEEGEKWGAVEKLEEGVKDSAMDWDEDEEVGGDGAESTLIFKSTASTSLSEGSVDTEENDWKF